MILSLLHKMPRKEHVQVDEVEDIFICEVDTEIEAFEEIKKYLNLLNIGSISTFKQLFDLYNKSGEKEETIKYIDVGCMAGDYNSVFLIRDKGRPYYNDIMHFFCTFYNLNENDCDEWCKLHNPYPDKWLIYHRDLCKRKGGAS